MKTPAYYLQRLFSHIFDSAIRGDKWAILILQVSKPLSAIPKGLWYFRTGDVSKSLSTLSKARIKPKIAIRYIEQGKDIVNTLSEPLPPPVSRSKEIQKFNGRVLFACHFSGKFNLNGYTVRTADIANALVNKGVTVKALTRLGYPWDSGESNIDRTIQYSKFRGLQYVHRYDPYQLITGAHSRYIGAYAEYLEDVAKKKNISVIHAHSNYLNGLAAQKVCSVNGWLSVYEVRGLWHLSRASQESGYLDSEHFKFCEHMEIKAALMCDQVVTLNAPLKAWMCERGVPAEKISIVPNGTRQPDTQISSRNSSETPVIGYAGALTAYEGIDDTLKALAILKAKGQQVMFQIAGHGDHETVLRSLADRLGISDSVDFLGEISAKQMNQFYQQVDIVVLARKNLPVNQLVPPLKLVEALAHGKAVIISNLPPLTDIMGSETLGLITDPNNPQALSEAISVLIQSPDQLKEMSQSAFQSARDRFSWEHLTQKYIDVYTTVDTMNRYEHRD